MILSVLSALAEPTRLAAPQILHDGDKHCVCDLMRRLGVTQGRMSRHMRVLKQAGPLIDRRDAQMRYRIKPDLAPHLRRLLDAAWVEGVIA